MDRLLKPRSGPTAQFEKDGLTILKLRAVVLREELVHVPGFKQMLQGTKTCD